MSKREQAMVAEKRQIAAEKAELAQHREEVKAHKAALAAAKRNPIEALTAMGLSYDDITNYITNNNQLTPELKTRAEIDEARAEARKAAEGLENFKKEQETKATEAKAAQEKALRETFENNHRAFYDRTVAFVRANAVQYELTNLHGAQIEVPKLIEAVHARSGKLLTKEEAAEQIENYFVEQTEKALNSEKWKKLQAAKATPAVKSGAPSTPTAPQRQTLSNDLTAPSTGKTPAPKKESAEDRMARAKAAFNAAKDRKS
jgi:hypothetical protein